MENYTQLLIIQFKNILYASQISQFRGAILHLLGANPNVLFHNHTEDNYRYSYPLIQYKRIKGKAAIVCINNGTEEIGQLFSHGPFDIHIGNTPMTFEIEKIHPSKTLIKIWNSRFRYRINKWLPLNSDNYKKFAQLDGIAEQIIFLENILNGNILSMLKGLGIHLEQPLISHITDISSPYLIENKHVKMTAYNIEFTTNISLPDYIGIGKNASIGYGIVTQIKETTETGIQS